MNNLRKNLTSSVWRYYGFNFFRSFAFFSAVLIPFFTEWGGISLAKVTFLQSWFMFWIFIMEVPTGAIADYIGRKWSLVLGALVVALAALIYGSFPRFEIFLLSELLFGIAMALMSGADDAWLYDTLKEENREDQSKYIMGKARSWELMGMFISAPLGGLLAKQFGINSPMLFSAIPFFFAALIALSLKEPLRKDKTSESKRYLVIVKTGLNYLKNHRQLKLLAIDSIGIAVSAYFVIWFYQILFRKIGLPIVYFGIIHAILVGWEMIISANFRFFEKLFRSAKNYFRISALLTGLAFLLAGIFPSYVSAGLFLFFAGGFGLTRAELLSPFINRHVPSEQRATILSSISMFRRIALVVFNPFMGLLADKSFSLAMVSAGTIALLVFFFSPIRKMELE